MADTKISGLTAYTTPIDTDVVPIVDITNTTTKKITWANIKATLWGTVAALTVAFNEAKGADIASATTTDIGAATGNFIDITGTTTITGLGTIQAGTERTVRFTGILLLTYNATSLILPTSANITTQAGDVAKFRSLGSGNWVCVTYIRKDGKGLVSEGSTVVIETTTGTTHSLTTVANQKVIVWVKGYLTGGYTVQGTVTLKYNTVQKDSSYVYIHGFNGDCSIPFALMYTETPGAATQNITVETDGGTLTGVVIIVQKIS